ncbi:hypothetical protein B0H10DRAFT_1969632 [Mycena sp. CBHHK59/15]|nr:hypothetical protein B0H10DRAFT_1969632 [Mycena sp. CBHHK59/15]
MSSRIDNHWDRILAAPPPSLEELAADFPGYTFDTIGWGEDQEIVVQARLSPARRRPLDQPAGPRRLAAQLAQFQAGRPQAPDTHLALQVKFNESRKKKLEQNTKFDIKDQRNMHSERKLFSAQHDRKNQFVSLTQSNNTPHSKLVQRLKPHSAANPTPEASSGLAGWRSQAQACSGGPTASATPSITIDITTPGRLLDTAFTTRLDTSHGTPSPVVLKNFNSFPRPF